MRVGLVVLATQKYIQFLPALYASAKKHLLKNHDVHYFFLTDNPREKCPAVVEFPDATLLAASHYDSFIDTMLNRYRQVLAHEKSYSEMDYLIHQDADMVYVDDVGDEIISPDVFATTSPNLPYNKWWATGSLLGGQHDKFLNALRDVQSLIDNGPIHKQFPEEEKWNQWLLQHLPSVMLPVEYCYPDRPSRRDTNPKIITLTTKDHLKAKK